MKRQGKTHSEKTGEPTELYLIMTKIKKLTENIKIVINVLNVLLEKNSQYANSNGQFHQKDRNYNKE